MVVIRQGALILLLLSRTWFCWSWSNWLSKLILICLHATYCQSLFSVTSTWSFCFSFQRISLFFFFFFLKCKPTVAAACSKGSPILDLLFCQAVRLSLSNLPQQLAFPDVNVDAVSVISFRRRQKNCRRLFFFLSWIWKKDIRFADVIDTFVDMIYELHDSRRQFFVKKSWNRKAATKSSPKSISLMFSAKCSLFRDSFKVNQINWYSSNILKA